MGNSQSIQKINFEDIQFVLKNKESFILINTLLEAEQDCLISGTISINKEIELINHCIKNGKKQYFIISCPRCSSTSQSSCQKKH